MKRILFETNSADWYRRDLRNEVTDIVPSKSVQIIFDNKDEIVRWLRENRSEYSWIYVPQEIETAILEKHIFPYVKCHGRIIGYVKVGFKRVYIMDYNKVIDFPDKDSFIYDTFILPEFRGENIAPFLLNETIKYLRNQGYERLWCHIPSWNTSSRRAFAKLNFERVDCIRYLRILNLSFFTGDPQKLLKIKNKENKMVTRRSLIKGFLGYLFTVPVILFFNWVKGSFAFPILRNESKNLSSGNGKVVVIQNERATSWDYKTKRYLDYIDQNVVNTMVDEGICKLTCSQDPEGAWQRIMGSYKKGDRVAIKPNFNNINNKYHECFTSPQVINSVVKGLVEYIEVPAEDIYVYDLCKEIPKELVRDRINYKVNYVERLNLSKFKDKVKLRLGLSLSCADRSEIIKMRNKVTDSNGNEVTCYIPKVLTDVNHLINISFLTNHIYILASGPLKNHFGTVRFSTFAQYPGCLHGNNIEEHIVDINLNPHIRNKTRLYICDGLFGVYARGDRSSIHKWSTFPCKNGTPNSLLFSIDPLAMEKRIADIVIKERKYHGYKRLPHHYLSDYKSQMAVGFHTSQFKTPF